MRSYGRRREFQMRHLGMQQFTFQQAMQWFLPVSAKLTESFKPMKVRRIDKGTVLRLGVWKWTNGKFRNVSELRR